MSASPRSLPPIANGYPSPPEINARLFYHLGQFVVWAEQNKDVAAGHPELATLLEAANNALARGGVLEQPIQERYRTA